MKKLLLLLPIVLLTACEPQTFGVPQSTWNTLSPEQKQQVIAGYNQRQQIDAENAPIQNAINTAGLLINSSQ